jgi:hypothetical protein
MTKRKATTASKPARGLKISAKTQRTKAAIIKGPKASHVHSVAAESIRSPKDHNDPRHEDDIIEIAVKALQAPLKQTSELKKGLDFSSAAATAQAYQAKLLEMGQANMKFALEFAHRLAAVRSPIQLLHVIEELTTKRIAMFRKYSSEMIELSMNR